MEYLQARFTIPKEIITFIDSVFEVYEIRALAGEARGIVFEIRTKEHNHTIPHVHAVYGEYNISIAIGTGEILSGNLPRKNRRIAVDWVLAHQNELMTKWKDIAVSAISYSTKTFLDLGA